MFGSSSCVGREGASLLENHAAHFLFPRPARWHKAKKVQLTPGQTEVKIDLPLPIVASNLMIEFADFYENYQASTETLQCPRCSASVPANPGVCGNCGENVYQCHKCRYVSLPPPYGASARASRSPRAVACAGCSTKFPAIETPGCVRTAPQSN